MTIFLAIFANFQITMNVPVGYVEALVGDLQEINRQKDVEIEDLEQQKEADVAEIAALRAELDFHQNIADKLLKVNEDMKEISKKKVRSTFFC